MKNQTIRYVYILYICCVLVRSPELGVDMGPHIIVVTKGVERERMSNVTWLTR